MLMSRPDARINRYTEASHHVMYSSRHTNDSKWFEGLCYEPPTTVDANGVPCFISTVAHCRPCSPTKKKSTTDTNTQPVNRIYRHKKVAHQCYEQQHTTPVHPITILKIGTGTTWTTQNCRRRTPHELAHVAPFSIFPPYSLGRRAH